MSMWKRWFPIMFPSVCFIGVLFALSCDDTPTPLTQDEKLTQEEHDELLEAGRRGKHQVSTDKKIAIDLMPPGHQNLVDLGNQWYTFELDGRKFLFRWEFDSYDHSRRHITITEITWP